MSEEEAPDMAEDQVQREVNELLMRIMPQGTTLGLFSRLSKAWMKLYLQAAEGKID